MLAVGPSQWCSIMIRLAVTTGLRRAELWNLVWPDVDFERKRLTVSRKIAGTIKVKGETYPVLEWSPKTH